MDKKHKSEGESSFKSKKVKTRIPPYLINPIPYGEARSKEFSAEILNAETIREGMLILGCVTEIKQAHIVMSLPGFLTGIVEINNISEPFTQELRKFTNNGDDLASFHHIEELSIQRFIKVGMVFPCKVIDIIRLNTKKGKFDIKLSINPKDVNAELRPYSIYPGMVLHVAVETLEDHGCLVDVGRKCIQAFLHIEKGCAANKIGSVIPTYVKRIISSNIYFVRLQLCQLNFVDDYPDITEGGDLKLDSVLPGARMGFDVIEVKHPFVFMKFSGFDACASLLSLGNVYKTIKVGSEIFGTVLYIHPVTRMIYTMLNSKTHPGNFHQYFGVKKFQQVQNLKYEGVYKGRSYYELERATHGFIISRHQPDRGHNPSVAKAVTSAVIIELHYLDNLIQMSAEPPLLEQVSGSSKDINIGDVYQAIVRKHIEGGMYVSLFPGVFGFVRKVLISDVYLTQPQLRHPVGSKVMCRVLSKDKILLHLATKDNLVFLQERYILTSYENAQCGQFYKGVIVKITDSYILVLFFNNVKGYVAADRIPKEAVFYEGQFVVCEVLKSIPSENKLILSLETQEWCSIEEVDDDWDAELRSNVEEGYNHPESNVESKSELDKMRSSSKDEINTECTESSSRGPVEAVIEKVGGLQLNIILSNTKGRVHITQLGCTEEGAYPLRGFSRGQKISVNVVGEYTKKNSLILSHRDETLKECSLNLPSVTLTKDFIVGSSQIAFVEDVQLNRIIMSLSPSQTGVLDFLHFSENIRELRKLCKTLKVGMALEISILEVIKDSDKENKLDINLTKIEKTVPEVGRNIIGFALSGSVERGLYILLPFGYHGDAALTDLSDIYDTATTLFDKCCRSGFVLCHILEVDHKKKYCQLSLRKTRLYKKKCTDCTYCPEILPWNIKEGYHVKGFVKAVYKHSLAVVFGRNLEGTVEIHRCSVKGCMVCFETKFFWDKYSVGDIIPVKIEEIRAGGSDCILNVLHPCESNQSYDNRLQLITDFFYKEDSGRDQILSAFKKPDYF